MAMKRSSIIMLATLLMAMASCEKEEMPCKIQFDHYQKEENAEHFRLKETLQGYRVPQDFILDGIAHKFLITDACVPWDTPPKRYY